MKRLSWILAALLASAPVAAAAPPAPVTQGVPRPGGAPPASAEEVRAYALREEAAAGLEDFQGGHAGGLVLLIVLVVAVVVLVGILVPW